jgi:redox-sensitive bicupin YhaK (pirin superfamily)
MSKIDLIIEERAADIGNFLVGRLLPFRQKRMVGPFIFIDHMGPAHLKAGEALDVGPHPHIGLSTLTYLFDGAILHRDSVDTTIEITPGAVNWMTAGKGIVHSERTPGHLQQKAHTLHGFQIWVALPKEKEFMEPSFQHIAAQDLPTWEKNGATFKLIAGAIEGMESPVDVQSPMYFIEIKASKEAVVSIGNQLFGEAGLYILDGAVVIDGQSFHPKQLLVAKNPQLCDFTMAAGSTVYIFGGTAFPEPRFIDWNFVASEKETLATARANWKAQTFPKIPGDNSFVPLPEAFKK